MNRHLSDKIPAPTSGRLLLLALLLCICGSVSADPQAVQHLPNLTIRNFAQDKVGYIWIATDNGLCRYNGQTYYYYQSEPDNPASGSTTSAPTTKARSGSPQRAASASTTRCTTTSNAC